MKAIVRKNLSYSQSMLELESDETYWIIITCLGAFLSVLTYILDRSDFGVKAVAADSEANKFIDNNVKFRKMW